MESARAEPLTRGLMESLVSRSATHLLLHLDRSEVERPVEAILQYRPLARQATAQRIRPAPWPLPMRGFGPRDGRTSSNCPPCRGSGRSALPRSASPLFGAAEHTRADAWYQADWEAMGPHTHSNCRQVPCRQSRVHCSGELHLIDNSGRRRPNPSSPLPSLARHSSRNFRLGAGSRRKTMGGSRLVTIRST